LQLFSGTYQIAIGLRMQSLTFVRSLLFRNMK
jgi:hypothetical protein